MINYKIELKLKSKLQRAKVQRNRLLFLLITSDYSTALHVAQRFSNVAYGEREWLWARTRTKTEERKQQVDDREEVERFVNAASLNAMRIEKDKTVRTTTLCWNKISSNAQVASGGQLSWNAITLRLWDSAQSTTHHVSIGTSRISACRMAAVKLGRSVTVCGLAEPADDAIKLLPRSNGPAGINAIICVDAGVLAVPIARYQNHSLDDPLHASPIQITNLQVSHTAPR